MKQIKNNLVKIKDPITKDWEGLPALVGESAYDIAIKTGAFSGTEEEWANYIKNTADRAGQYADAMEDAVDGTIISDTEESGVTTYSSQKINTELKKKATYFNSVASMKEDNSLKAGDVVVTLGYYEANDGGGATYLVRTKTGSDVDNGGSVHALAKNDVVAEYVNNGIINLLQYGFSEKNTGERNTEIFNKMFEDTSNMSFALPKGKYKVNNCKISGNNIVLDFRGTLLSENTQGATLLIGKEDEMCSSIIIRELHIENESYLYGDDTIGLQLLNVVYSNVNNIFISSHYIALYLTGKTHGTQCNIIKPRVIQDFYYGIKFAELDEGGWVNQNVFVGGEYRTNQSNPHNDKCYHIYMDRTSINGNSFFGCSFEGNENSVINLGCSYTYFFGCRFESEFSVNSEINLDENPVRDIIIVGGTYLGNNGGEKVNIKGQNCYFMSSNTDINNNVVIRNLYGADNKAFAVKNANDIDVFSVTNNNVSIRKKIDMTYLSDDESFLSVYNSAHDHTLKMFIGDNSPEGRVDAYYGSLFFVVNSNYGVYIKTTSLGNLTGWKKIVLEE